MAVDIEMEERCRSTSTFPVDSHVTNIYVMISSALKSYPTLTVLDPEGLFLGLLLVHWRQRDVGKASAMCSGTL